MQAVPANGSRGTAGGIRRPRPEEDNAMARRRAGARRKRAEVREMRIAVGNVSFDEIVKILQDVWRIPKGPGIGGCDPCRSGLDRFVIEDIAQRFG
jgi:hypothetical protein